MQRKNETEFKTSLVLILCFASERGCEGCSETSPPWSGSAVKAPWLPGTVQHDSSVPALGIAPASCIPRLYLTGQTSSEVKPVQVNPASQAPVFAQHHLYLLHGLLGFAPCSRRALAASPAT